MSPIVWQALIELAAAVLKDVVSIILHASSTDVEKVREIERLHLAIIDTKRRVQDVEI